MESNPNQPLNFDQAVPAGSAGFSSTCMVCKQSIVQTYYSLNGQMFCPSCKNTVLQGIGSGQPAVRVLKAFLFGLPAAIVGAAIFYLIAAMTGYEFGLIAILIGYAVGYAVRKGSEGLGGLPYQIIAVVLTYGAICSTYIPSMVKGIEAESARMQTSASLSESGQVDAPVTGDAQKPKTISPIGYVILFIFALALPFMSGLQNILGLLIIGFGLYQAWQMNIKTKLNFQGPFEIKSSGP